MQVICYGLPMGEHDSNWKIQCKVTDLLSTLLQSDTCNALVAAATQALQPGTHILLLDTRFSLAHPWLTVLLGISVSWPWHTLLTESQGWLCVESCTPLLHAHAAIMHNLLGTPFPLLGTPFSEAVCVSRPAHPSACIAAIMHKQRNDA